MAEKIAATSEADREGLSESLAALYVAMIGELFGSYHPERHYMRGPGPKWHAKHCDAGTPAPIQGADSNGHTPLYPGSIPA